MAAEGVLTGGWLPVLCRMPRFTFKFLKKHTRALVDKFSFGDVITDEFLLQTLRFHPKWEQKARLEGGGWRKVRKEKFSGDYRLVLINENGSIHDDISLDAAVRIRTGVSLRKKKGTPNSYKKN